MLVGFDECILSLVIVIVFSFIGLFILLIEMPFCCAFIPQTEIITRAVDKMGQLPIAIACIIHTNSGVHFGKRASAPSFRRARSQGGVGLRAEPGLHNAPRSAYSGVENAFPPAAPAYGADSMMDRVAAGAAMGAAQAAMQGPGY
ncbi:unnamed protein product [Taenia asiatica]|uniref:Uncharacterized protein n=1 Tax=Taenia asiatica TaxID=60517 RepID=A0A3P6PJZ2_TAEAS|nr:unnamed protein product [Taenia asiatica]